MKTSDILNKAAEMMMERGHSKYTFGTPDGDDPVCIVGACMQVGPLHGTLTYLRTVIGSEYVMAWNDRDETTEAMAIGALHEAALLAKEQGD